MSRIWTARDDKENGQSIRKGQSASPEGPPPDQLVDKQSLRTSYLTGEQDKIGVLNSNGMGCLSPFAAHWDRTDLDAQRRPSCPANGRILARLLLQSGWRCEPALPAMNIFQGKRGKVMVVVGAVAL